MFKKTIISALSLGLMTVSLLSTPAHAKNNQTTVSFKAAIVVPTCSYNIKEGNVDLQCFNNDSNKMKTTSIDFKNHAKSTEWKTLDNNRGTYQLNWTNKDKGLAMFTVQHV